MISNQSLKVAILILTYNSEDYITDCLNSLEQQTYTNFKIFIVDNNSQDNTLTIIENKFPEYTIIKNLINYGYAKGNNIGLKMAFRQGFDLVFILNPDTTCNKDSLEILVTNYIKLQQKNIKVGLIQPSILLYDNPSKINTIGNSINYLGFGYCKDYLNNFKLSKSNQTIISVSGAAMLISKQYYKDIGTFNNNFFLYNEDQDLSWRGLLMEYQHFVVNSSIVYHKYSFSKNKMKMFYSEKNRIIIIMTLYSLRTLLFLFPILIVNELLVLSYSLFDGWLIQKIASYKQLFLDRVIILKTRRNIQNSRVVSDRDLIKNFDSELNFKVFDNILIHILINPLYNLYYNIILKIL